MALFIGNERGFAACTGTPTHICVDHNGTAFVVNGVARGTLNLVIGTTYEFELNAGNFTFHPFVLTTSATGGFGSTPLGSSDGVQGPNPANATGQIVRFTPARTNRVYYQCAAHANMGAAINVAAAPPSISGLNDQVIHQNTSTGPLPFAVGDSGTAATNLVVSALSSNVVLVPTNDIVFGGSGSNRTVTVTPAPDQTGATLISIIIANPSGSTATNSFVLTVVALRLNIVSGDANSNIIEFNALSNRTYTLESRNSLGEGSFAGLPIPSAPTNRVVQITNDVSGVNSRYYRLATPRIP